MSLESVTVETRGHVVLIGLNRPAKRNAFDLALYSELGVALGAYERDPRLRCAVLHAHGEHFTGGLELAAVAALLPRRSHATPSRQARPTPFSARRSSPSRW